MSEPEIPSCAHPRQRVIQPRHAHREIAELLAAAVVRMREKHCIEIPATDREVFLGFCAEQSVNANPSYAEGFRN